MTGIAGLVHDGQVWLAADALTFGLMRKAVERDALEIQLKLVFPDDWRVLLDTMDKFDRASCYLCSPYIKQMWSIGGCPVEETIALMQRCPAAFLSFPVGEVIGQRAADILPKMAATLP